MKRSSNGDNGDGSVAKNAKPEKLGSGTWSTHGEVLLYQSDGAKVLPKVKIALVSMDDS